MRLREIPITAWIGLFGIALAIFCAIFAPLIAPYGETEVVGGVWEAADGQFFFGLDNIMKIIRMDYVFAYNQNGFFDQGLKISVRGFTAIYSED